MTASLAGLFTLQAFADAGVLLASGRLYTYIQGTTTQKTAYTDAAGSVAHTYTSDGAGGQYIALNARGELPAPLYLNTGSYDIVLKTSSGATVWTRRADPINDAVPVGLAPSSGSSFIGFLQAGTGAVARTLQSKGRDIVSVKDFGAVGDYNATTLTGTDDSAAFAAAILYAMTANPDGVSAGTVYVPHGQYLVTANNFLGATNFFALNGIAGRIHFSMVGDGWNSQIYFKPSGGVANYYMYQNTPGQNNLIDWVFSNLYFRLDSSNVAAGSTLNCFLENASPGYATQGIKCDRVKIVGADYPSTAAQIAAAGTVFTCNGTVNADVTNMIGCRVRGMKTLLDIGTNAQSVCHTFVATDAEVMYGDVFKIGGGSSVNVFGGSYTMFTSASTLSYLVAVRETTVALAGTLNFYGMRCEFNYPDPGTPTTAYSCAFFLDGVGSAGDSWNSTFVKVNFEGCNFYPTDGASRNMINVDAASKSVINFRGCDLGNTSLWKVNVFSSKATLQVASNGPFTAVNFREGYAPLFSNVTYTDTNSVARISVRDCPNTIDYDLSANGISETKIGRARTLKTATIWGGAWTDVGVSVMSLQLPPNCLIKSVRFRKVAGGASVTTYQLQATDSNSVVNYCSSTIAAQNVNHEAFGDNLNIVANTAAKQLIYIINPAGQAGASVSTPMAAGDYVMVDYY